MGLFSRRDRAPKPDSFISPSQSHSSANSGAGTPRSALNRTSAGSSILPGSPLSPMSSVKIPKIDLPRPPDPQLDPAGYLRSLGAVRERSRLLLRKAKQNDLSHFDVDFDKFPDVVAFVSGLIKVRCATYAVIFNRGLSRAPPPLTPPPDLVGGAVTTRLETTQLARHFI